jgi:arylsulfatase A-like enzyme
LLLESKGKVNNTMIVFQSDHGLEGKFSLYEDGIQIMQFIHYPNEFPDGSTYHGLVATIDVTPTLVDFAGINATSPGWYDMDGMSWRLLPQDLD